MSIRHTDMVWLRQRCWFVLCLAAGVNTMKPHKLQRVQRVEQNRIDYQLQANIATSLRKLHVKTCLCHLTMEIKHCKRRSHGFQPVMLTGGCSCSFLPNFTLLVPGAWCMRCWWAINPFGGLKRKSARRFLQPMCAILPACPKQRSTSCFATGFWTAAGDDGPGADGIYIYIPAMVTMVGTLVFIRPKGQNGLNKFNMHQTGVKMVDHWGWHMMGDFWNHRWGQCNCHLIQHDTAPRCTHHI